MSEPHFYFASDKHPGLCRTCHQRANEGHAMRNVLDVPDTALRVRTHAAHRYALVAHYRAPSERAAIIQRAGTADVLLRQARTTDRSSINRLMIWDRLTNKVVYA